MDQYLNRHAEPELEGLDGFPRDRFWEQVLVLPACRESTECIRPLPPGLGKSLLILVINQARDASAETFETNRILARFVQSRYVIAWQSEPEHGLFLLTGVEENHDILLVDCFSKNRCLPAKGGVGHARKIGADLAAMLIWQKNLRSPWIHCSDADVTLPVTYFSAANDVLPEQAGIAALIYPFHHCGDANSNVEASVEQATQLYEFSLHYYVAGLAYAGSPYAFHTIGSTIAINHEHYKQVRGFPRRAAAEDFYLLNKLAKLGEVKQLQTSEDCEAIRITPRLSDRVPFGTGAAVGKMIRLENAQKDFMFYRPVVFELLKAWIQSWSEIWNSGPDFELNISNCPDLFHELSNGNSLLLFESLKELKVHKALTHAFRQSGTVRQFLVQMHTWFDGFKTLRLIHILRNRGLASVAFDRLIKHEIFIRIVQEKSDFKAYYRNFSEAADSLKLTPKE